MSFISSFPPEHPASLLHQCTAFRAKYRSLQNCKYWLRVAELGLVFPQTRTFLLQLDFLKSLLFDENANKNPTELTAKYFHHETTAVMKWKERQSQDPKYVCGVPNHFLCCHFVYLWQSRKENKRKEKGHYYGKKTVENSGSRLRLRAGSK